MTLILKIIFQPINAAGNQGVIHDVFKVFKKAER